MNGDAGRLSARMFLDPQFMTRGLGLIACLMLIVATAAAQVAVPAPTADPAPKKVEAQPAPAGVLVATPAQPAADANRPAAPAAAANAAPKKAEAQPAPAGVVVGGMAPAARVVGGNAAQPAADPSKPPEADNPFAYGAALETDPEVDRYLRRAEDLVNEGNYREAAVIFQHVLDNCGDLMVLAVSREAGGPAGVPERIYRPLREHVERQLADPQRRELLAAYRLTADPEAQGALDAGGQRMSEDALRQVVRRFFVSARGDDAAYRLGCLLLDRYQFSSARYMFQKVLGQHPDPSLPRSDLLLRLAVACARAGDTPGAEKALTQLTAETAQTPAEVVAQVRAEIARGGPAPGVETAGWHMDLGTPARNGHMKPLTGDAAQPKQFWTESWQFQSVLQPAPTQGRVIIQDPFSGITQQQSYPVRGQIVQRWKKNGWIPTGDVLLDNGRVYLKSRSFRDPQATGGSPVPGLACLDAMTGTLLWLAREEVPASTTNVNASHVIYMNQAGQANQERPATGEEVEFFGDHLSRTLTLLDGTVYCLESCSVPPGGRARRVIFHNQRTVSGGQRLAAVDAKTGKLRWRIVGATPRTPDPNQPFQMQGPSPEDRFFLAAPLRAGNVLLVPVLRNQTLQLQALAPQDGRLVWEKPLCLEANMVPRDSTVGLAIDGSEAYVATGAGLVMALDAADGRVLWAARYLTDKPADANPQQQIMFASMYGMRQTEGWSRDVIIPCGGTLLVMPSDAKRILYFDRHTGELRGRADQGEAKYVLGVLGDRLLVAGNNQVACYSTREPKRIWTADSSQGITGSTGRGALTEQVLYIPVTDAIVLLDTKNGKALGRIPVDTSHHDPIGSLVCDGQNLIATGMERTYALNDGRVHLARLAERIEKGEVDALVSRSGLRYRLGQVDDALADLRRAHEISRADTEKQAIADQLVDRLLTLARQKPNLPALLDEASQLAKTHPQRVRVELARARRLADAGQVIEALPLLVSLAGDPEGILVALDGDDGNCRTLSAHVAAAELRRIIGRDGAAIAERVQAEVAKLEPRLAELKQKPDAYPATLLRLAYGLSGLELASPKTQAAAEFLRERGAIELAENALLQAERSPHRPTAAAAVAARAELYERIGWTADAWDTWNRLAESWSGVALPGRGGQTAEQLARQQLERLPKTAADEAAAAKQTPAPPWKQLWQQNNVGELGFSRTADPPSHFLNRHLLFVNQQDRNLQFIDAATGKATWTYAISQSNLSMSRSGTRVLMFNGFHFPNGQLPRDGHVGILRTPGQARALGLVSGKMLWPGTEATPDAAGAQAGFPQHFYNPQFAGGQITTLDVAAGVLAEVVTGNAGPNCTVRVRDLMTGKTCWERDFEFQPLQGVRVHGEFVTAALQGGELQVCDRATGAKLGRFSPDTPPSIRWMAFTESGVVHCTADSLVCRRLPDGQVAWKLPFAAIHVQRFEMPDRRTLCIVGRQADGTARALVVNTINGQILTPIPNEAVGMNPLSIALTRDRKQVHITAYDNQGGHRLTILEVATAKTLASFSLGRMNRPIQGDEPLGGGELIPLLISDPLVRVNNNSFRASNLHSVYFLRKSDGKVLKGLKLPSPREDGKIENATAVTVRGPALLLYTHQGVTAYGHDPAGTAPQFEAVEPASVIPAATVPGQPGVGMAVPIQIQGGAIQVQVQAVAEPVEEARPARRAPAFRARAPMPALPVAPAAKPPAPPAANPAAPAAPPAAPVNKPTAELK